MSTEVTRGCYWAPSPNTGGMEESEELPGEAQTAEGKKGVWGCRRDGGHMPTQGTAPQS